MAPFGDLGYGLRILRRTPSVALPAIASLALGIAVNTTMFTVVDALLLRPLPTSGPDALVRIGRSVNDDRSFRSVSHEEFAFLREHATSIDELVGHEISSLFLTASAGVAGSAASASEFVSAELVTSNYFRALKRPPTIGRAFDERAGDEMSIVVSDRLWRRRFAADPAIVGRDVALNNHTFTIEGVAPAGFTGMFPGVVTDVWLPAVRIDEARRTDPRAIDSTDVLGILAPRASIAAARAELAALERRMSELDPRRDPRRRLVIADARGIHPGLARHIAPFALAMMAIVGVVLLIVCANVSGLLLARASARRPEIAIRLAVGASRGRVSRLLLAESGLLASAGAAAGVLLTFWAVRSINALTLIPGPTGTPVFLDLRLNARVLVFTAAVAAIATIVFGLLPALHGTRIDLISALKDPQSAPGRKRARLRSALVVVQVAVSVVLLVGAVLLIRSVRNSTRLDLGFAPDGVGVVSFNLQVLGYDRIRSEQFYSELLRRTRALVGVERAALAAFVPMAGSGATITVLNPRSTLPDGGRVSAAYNRVSDDYFATVRQPLVRGREFTPRDRPGALVAIVNETLARRLFPDDDALGRRIRIVAESGDAGTEHEVIGVVRDARYGSFGGSIGPFVFFPALEGLGRAETLHVRATSPQALTAALTAAADAARAIDDRAAPKSSQPMREAMSFALIPALIAQTVLGVAGAIAMILAVGGVYSLIAYALQLRLKEIAVRVALGANRIHIFNLIVGSTVRLTIAGAAIGLLASAGATRLLTSLLIDLSPTDTLTFAGVGGLLIAATLAAGFVVARRGLDVDPATVLKYD